MVWNVKIISDEVDGEVPLRPEKMEVWRHDANDANWSIIFYIESKQILYVAAMAPWILYFNK